MDCYVKYKLIDLFVFACNQYNVSTVLTIIEIACTVTFELGEI